MTGPAPGDPGSPEHPGGPDHPPALRAAFRAAFHGRPGEGAARGPAGSVEDDCSGGPTEPWYRWASGVCLGALGHYQRAAEVLLVGEPDSLCASTRASHLRQLGRHAEAEALDLRALALAPSSVWPAAATADALVGLAADAVAGPDPSLVVDRLAVAAGHIGRLVGPGHWRARVRLDWVRAECALRHARPRSGYPHAVAALRASRAAAAPRHRAKSLLVLGVTGHLAGRSDAARVLSAAARRADRLGVPTVAWPALLVLARVLSAADPAAAERALAAAHRILRTIAANLPSAEGAGFLASQGVPSR